MYFSASANFTNIVLYIQGILFGYELATGVKLEREISAWYQEHTDFKAPNMEWFGQVETEWKDLTEEEKKSNLFAILGQFFAQRLE